MAHHLSDLPALRQQREALKTEVRNLADADNLTPAQEKRFDAALAEFDRVDQAVRGLEGVAAGNAFPAVGKDIQVMNRVTPWTGDSHVAARDRAMAALERSRDLTDHARDNVLAMAERGGDDAEVIERGTDPAVCSAYSKYLLNPQGAHLEFSDDERRAWQRYGETRTTMATTGVTGLVPVPFDPRVTITADGVANPFRRIARVERTAATTYTFTKSASLSAHFVAEGTESSDDTPTLSTVVCTPERAQAFVAATFEAVEDAASLAQNVTNMISDAANVLESAKFHSGAGHGSNEPLGIMTVLQSNSSSCMVTGSSGAASAATLVLQDVLNVDNALPERWQAQGPTWVMGRSTANALRTLIAAQNSGISLWGDVASTTAGPQLLGHPVEIASAMDTTIVSGSQDDCVILGSFQNMVVVDRLPMQVIWHPFLVGASGRPNGTGGWYARWRTTSDVIAPTAFRFLRL